MVLQREKENSAWLKELETLIDWIVRVLPFMFVMPQHSSDGLSNMAVVSNNKTLLQGLQSSFSDIDSSGWHKKYIDSN